MTSVNIDKLACLLLEKTTRIYTRLNSSIVNYHSIKEMTEVSDTSYEVFKNSRDYEIIRNLILTEMSDLTRTSEQLRHEYMLSELASKSDHEINRDMLQIIQDINLTVTENSHRSIIDILNSLTEIIFIDSFFSNFIDKEFPLSKQSYFEKRNSMLREESLDMI